MVCANAYSGSLGNVTECAFGHAARPGVGIT